MNVEIARLLIAEARTEMLPGDEDTTKWRMAEALERLVGENEALSESVKYLVTHDTEARPWWPEANS